MQSHKELCRAIKSYAEPYISASDTTMDVKDKDFFSPPSQSNLRKMSLLWESSFDKGKSYSIKSNVICFVQKRKATIPTEWWMELFVICCVLSAETESD